MVVSFRLRRSELLYFCGRAQPKRRRIAVRAGFGTKSRGGLAIDHPVVQAGLSVRRSSLDAK